MSPHECNTLYFNEISEAGIVSLNKIRPWEALGIGKYSKEKSSSEFKQYLLTQLFTKYMLYSLVA